MNNTMDMGGMEIFSWFFFLSMYYFSKIALVNTELIRINNCWPLKVERCLKNIAFGLPVDLLLHYRIRVQIRFKQTERQIDQTPDRIDCTRDKRLAYFFSITNECRHRIDCLIFGIQLRAHDMGGSPHLVMRNDSHTFLYGIFLDSLIHSFNKAQNINMWN